MRDLGSVWRLAPLFLRRDCKLTGGIIVVGGLVCYFYSFFYLFLVMHCFARLLWGIVII